MAEAKFETLLNVSLGATPMEREGSVELGVGVFEEEQVFEIILKHTGDISFLEERLPGTRITQLLNGYAVGEVPEKYMNELANFPQIEYVEKPKLFFFQDLQSFAVSCINIVKEGPDGLKGTGVIVAVIDSGINILLPEFRKPDGSTRLLALWNQGDEGDGTKWHNIGKEYNQEEINQAIKDNRQIAIDLADHGTPVTAIACGNNGVANESDILFVKLLPSRQGGFPRTTQIMMAVDYVLRKAESLGKPVSVNLSFGNNYGPHIGNTILEQYLQDVLLYWKATICIGAGNEATSSTHASGKMENGKTERISFSVGPYQTAVNLQIWTKYVDAFEARIILPNGNILGTLNSYSRIQRFQTAEMEVLGYQGGPTPYSIYQETYFDFIPGDYVTPGIWQVELIPVRIVDGRYNMWFPASAVLNQGTGFLIPNAGLTMTVPGAGGGVITIGAYDGRTDSYAPFSGRGGEGLEKPDLVAPGVAVRASSAAGNVKAYTGTSFATPLAAGCCGLMMEWGIVRRNDLFLYGERVKAYLIRGARQLSGESTPSPRTGWGAICLNDSFPVG